jgi:hypothetical protein
MPALGSGSTFCNRRHVIHFTNIRELGACEPWCPCLLSAHVTAMIGFSSDDHERGFFPNRRLLLLLRTRGHMETLDVRFGFRRDEEPRAA